MPAKIFSALTSRLSRRSSPRDNAKQHNVRHEYKQQRKTRRHRSLVPTPVRDRSPARLAHKSRSRKPSPPRDRMCVPPERTGRAPSPTRKSRMRITSMLGFTASLGQQAGTTAKAQDVELRHGFSGVSDMPLPERVPGARAEAAENGGRSTGRLANKPRLSSAAQPRKSRLRMSSALGITQSLVKHTTISSANRDAHLDAKSSQRDPPGVSDLSLPVTSIEIPSESSDVCAEEPYLPPTIELSELDLPLPRFEHTNLHRTQRTQQQSRASPIPLAAVEARDKFEGPGTSALRRGTCAVDNSAAFSVLPADVVTAYLRKQAVALSNPGTGQSVGEKAAFVRPLLNARQAATLMNACGTLGKEPSSAAFSNHTKSIAFVICISGQWFQIKQDHFNQAMEYNDSSGGHKRPYDELPRSFIESRVTQRLLTSFKTVYEIPDGELVHVQVQASKILPEDAGSFPTGQGITLDGAARAMLVCLERDNVIGARSTVFQDVGGKRPTVDHHILSEGQALFWKNSEVYHYVEQGRLGDNTEPGRQTIMIAHYPAMQYITEQTNENTTLAPSEMQPEYVDVKNVS